MVIRGEILSISDERFRIILSDKGKKQEVDVFMSPNRKKLIKDHTVTVRSLVELSVISETVEFKDMKLSKFWLDFIIHPTAIIPRVESKKKGDSGDWSQKRN